jgi:hypothetical protein
MVTATCALLISAAFLARAESPTVVPAPEALLKTLAENGKPGAEHRKLDPLVGDWTFTMQVWTDPSRPPAEIKGSLERRWIMGGRFVQEAARSEFDGKTYEGTGLLGYDRARKQFTAVRACSLCGTINSGHLDVDPLGTRFTCTRQECCPVTGQKFDARDELVVESRDRVVLRMYKTFDGREVKVAELVSVRRK